MWVVRGFVFGIISFVRVRCALLEGSSVQRVAQCKVWTCDSFDPLIFDENGLCLFIFWSLLRCCCYCTIDEDNHVLKIDLLTNRGVYCCSHLLFLVVATQ